MLSGVPAPLNVIAYLIGVSGKQKKDNPLRSLWLCGELLPENELGTSGSIQKSITLLKKKNIIDVDGQEIRFNDVFFKEWIKKKML